MAGRVLLVPKLLLGNPECEALASQYRKLELLDMSSQAGAWELAEKNNEIAIATI